MISDGQRDTAAQNWATAVQTYRTALLAYRRLLDVRAQRRSDGLGLYNRVLPLVRAVPAPPPPTELAMLTPRERDVACLIARGCSNQQIAVELVLTRGTVANHVAHILEKVGVANRTQLAAIVLGRPRQVGLDELADAI